VQAGRSATFTAHTSGMNQPRYQWLRSADRGATYVDVAGATTAVLTLASAQFADEQAMFRVDVRDGTDSTVRVQSNAVLLLVSSLPAVVVQDGEFQAADWNTSAFVSPSPDGPTHAENRSPTGGLPGAFRHMVHTMTAGPSSLRVFNVNASAVYDPAAQGAIHALDYHEDCTILSASAPSFDVRSYPTLEQAGRRYVSTQGRGCLPQWVGNFGEIPTLQVYDFVQIDGPACASGQACPDFSATGAPLHFGFERRVRLANGVGAGSIEHGIDNWKFSVWRP
jgi:hypothetical protein